MGRFFQIAMALAVLNFPTGAMAQDKYDIFVGNWVASAKIAESCSGITTSTEQDAAEIARSQGLRKQKVLKLLFYSKTTVLEQQGNAALAARKLDPSNKNSLCKFGRGVAGKNDTIGRFLRAN